MIRAKGGGGAPHERVPFWLVRVRARGARSGRGAVSGSQFLCNGMAPPTPFRAAKNQFVGGKITSRRNRVVDGRHRGSTRTRAALTPIRLARGRDGSRKGKSKMIRNSKIEPKELSRPPNPTSSCDFSENGVSSLRSTTRVTRA